MGFSEDLGYLDNNTLLKYQNFQVSGMIMKKDKYEEIGGLKPSFRLTFNYEFLLRATYNDAVIMTSLKWGINTPTKDNIHYSGNINSMRKKNLVRKKLLSGLSWLRKNTFLQVIER